MEDGGAGRTRTDDILLAKQALYQLSYGPIGGGSAAARMAGRRSCRCCQMPEKERKVNPVPKKVHFLRVTAYFYVCHLRGIRTIYGPGRILSVFLL